MPILINANGTTSSTFGVGSDVLNYDNTNGLQVTSDGSTLATLQGATPTAADDFATKSYVDGATGGAASATLTVQDSHAFGDGTNTFQTTATAAQGTKAMRVIVEITSAYDAGTTIDAGFANATTAFINAAPVDSADTLIYDILVDQSNVAPQTFALTVTNGGGITQGALTIYYQYVTTIAT